MRILPSVGWVDRGQSASKSAGARGSPTAPDSEPSAHGGTGRRRLAPSEAEVLAPRWHTAALISLIVAVAVTGAILSLERRPVRPPPSASRIASVYLPVLAVQAGLAFYVCRIGRGASALASLLGRGWTSLGRACGDLALASAVWLFIESSETLFARLWPSRNASLLATLPRTGQDHVVWLVVAASAGFCEEVVYRGYLQKQLTAFTGRAGVAILVQALLFGIAHGEQGPSVSLRFALYAIGLGALARWRRSLLPGILGHIAVDLASGLLA
jgi:membrane protease YdiL (CAAX protease family)